MGCHCVSSQKKLKKAAGLRQSPKRNPRSVPKCEGKFPGDISSFPEKVQTSVGRKGFSTIPENPGRPHSVRFGYSLGVELIERFWFSVLVVQMVFFFCVSVQFNREGRFRFGCWIAVPAVPVPKTVPGKTVPVSVSGSALEPS